MRPDDLTAVEQFALQYDLRQIPVGQSIYKELIPKTAPGPGQQYSFEVDLDRCTGCKACVTACHNENGLDEDETWRSVGLIQGGPPENPAMQHVTTACHHCLSPACMDGCPTKAYIKDAETGIVRHLEDQCFGCQYCILKCPYDVPKYNKKRGIVHKCDMCIGRLKAGEAPACVRACPSGAIRISVIDKADVRANPQEYVKIPDAPASGYTLPTTKYKTKRSLPVGMQAIDYHSIKPEHSHFPLVVMLVLTQLSVGAFAAQVVLKRLIDPGFNLSFEILHILLSLGIGLLALAASVLHLGRPHLAFRAVLGFRTSWLSREIIAFGIFAASAVLYAFYHWTNRFSDVSSLVTLNYAVALMGIIGVLCSVKVYQDTQRPFWDNHGTTLKFLLTSVILGFATIFLTTLVWAAYAHDANLWSMTQSLSDSFLRIIMGAVGVKLLLEATVFLHLLAGQLSFIKKSAMLMTHHLKNYTWWRWICGIAGGILLPLIFFAYSGRMAPIATVSFAAVIVALLLAGEFLERYLFFRAVVPLKMPGEKIC